MASASSDPVLIIGAGISGLCLAQGLKKLNVPFKVFERDAEVAARAQGYRVRLLDGCQVIDQVVPAEISELFHATTAVYHFGMHNCDAITGEVQPFFDQQDGSQIVPAGIRPHVTRLDSDGGNPHAAASVDRHVLRDVLLTGISEHVVFGKAYSHFEIGHDAACVTAYFADGSTERGRLLVGADGKWSAVRRQHVPNHVLLDTGLGAFYGKTPLTAELRAIFERDTDLKGLVVVSDAQTLATPLDLLMEEMVWSPEADSTNAVVQVPKDYIYWVLLSERASLPFTEEELTGRLRHGDAAAQATLELTKRWTPELRKIFAGQAPQDTSYISVHSASPDMEAWKPSRYVTLVGDAVHGMPPFAAQGANTALRGVQLLYQAIEQHGVEGLTENIIGQFEAELRVMGVEKIEQSFESGRVAFRLKSPEYQPLKARY
ncbi:cercosporin toxin biosynthesis protein [Apiospora marii]|uniref:cercosporin toxin biosynthesis protein n=1 Tax=Apiospora marii TaxID=335849 RepID=UPI00312E96DD